VPLTDGFSSAWWRYGRTAVWFSTPPTVAENQVQSARKAVRYCRPASVME
jgi:hypothetical protein